MSEEPKPPLASVPASVPPSVPDSVPGVVEVERVDGARADRDAPPSLLVEVPHGADRREHYDALRDRLVGDLPEDLHVFFFVNTDVGAWDYGRRVAERVVQAAPERSALILRCLIPRTFVDTNRLEQAEQQSGAGGLTAGVAPYVRHPDDVELLLQLHRSYVAAVDAAYAAVCGGGGFALMPHTYGPRTLGIERVDERIVEALRWAHEPERYETWPLRPSVDLITRLPEGPRLAPEAMVEQLLREYAELGLDAVEGDTYRLHPMTQGHRLSKAYPGQVLCLEVRRDLLVERWTPFSQMSVRPGAADRVAAPLATAIDRWLSERRRL